MIYLKNCWVGVKQQSLTFSICYTFIFVLVLCMWYPVRSVGLCHLYICTSVVVSCSFRWFVSPLRWNCSWMCISMLYPVHSYGFCHHWVGTVSVVLISCIRFTPLVCYTFIFVLMVCMLYLVRSFGLLSYYCTVFQMTLSWDDLCHIDLSKYVL